MNGADDAARTAANLKAFFDGVEAKIEAAEAVAYYHCGRNDLGDYHAARVALLTDKGDDPLAYAAIIAGLKNVAAERAAASYERSDCQTSGR